MLFTYATTAQSWLCCASAPVRHEDRSLELEAPVSDELPPIPPFSSNRMIATTRPTAPPPMAMGDPETPRRSLTCDESRRARRRIRMAAALPRSRRHDASDATRRDARPPTPTARGRKEWAP